MNNQPIGIFDSGIGGLSIWQELTKKLPNESTIFVADSAYCPYGEKTTEQIYARSKKIIEFLLSYKVKLIVIACNTVTVTCIDQLRSEFPKIPIIGIVPVIKTAAEKSKKKRIGILSTVLTAESLYQKTLIERFARGFVVVNKGTNTLVPFVERGEVAGNTLQGVLRDELRPFQEADIDVLALGCSHYPFLEEEIQSVLGDHVQLLDSSGAVVRQVAHVLTHNNLHAITQPTHVLFTTGEKAQFITVVKKVLSLVKVDYITKKITIRGD